GSLSRYSKSTVRRHRRVSHFEVEFAYYGFLDDFYLDQDGQLDRIVLFDVYRRDIKSDDNGENNTERYYQIKGDRLILKYSQIINMNLEYLYIYEESSE
ncbi:hypothetical protein ACLHZT_20965, partial [Aeromonas veronii]|uniref:hypothetical protein n=1 Tax=Aeromonas veronii TaxID=654 RepID=UPI003D0781D8